MVISIDQGEELFSAEGVAEAGRILDLFAQTLSPPEGDDPEAVAVRQRALAVVTIRSDSYDVCRPAAARTGGAISLQSATGRASRIQGCG